ncbi:MAG: hypothetical protein CMI02_09980 [Oceanospirillaceae bacterium]|nr:hypothetical protein [Oceanospirillaceae bacterium]MBT12350.1 hypothetical protein [Oceanospirillaceae bacterium]
MPTTKVPGATLYRNGIHAMKSARNAVGPACASAIARDLTAQIKTQTALCAADDSQFLQLP